MVSPRSMRPRACFTAVSTTALPDVFAVMSRPARIGTPELIKVLRVRQNRATATFRRMGPTRGIRRRIESTRRRPSGVA